MLFKFFIIFFSLIYSNDKQLYSTVQMMDQVMVIDIESLQVDQSVSTEFASIDNDITICTDYLGEMECNMSSGCEWMMNMCMEQSDGDCMDYTGEMECSMDSNCIWIENHCMSTSDQCVDYISEMECSMQSGCEWMMNMCMESISSDEVNTPHFIVLDEINGYWFTTTIASGYIGQFSLLDNSLIDTYFVGDAPALLAIDVFNKKIYSSRMMPMNGMGNMMPSSESNIIQGLNYSAMGLTEFLDNQYEIGSPAPHGLAINEDGSELYTASNTADWLYKINILTGEIIGTALDSQVNNAPDQTTQRLKPIQCLSVGNKLFVSCSAGPWYNPYTGQETIIPGQIQMWDSNMMTLLDTIEIGDYTAPWHIKESPVDNVIYVALNGDNLYDTEGLACIRYENNSLNLEWDIYSPDFNSLHGVDVSHDGEKIYVSGRGDGNIHVFDNNGNYIDNLFLGSMTMLGGIAIEKKGIPLLGDLNNDDIINIYDVVLEVDNILEPMQISPYQGYSGDLNEDNQINITDIILLIDSIFNF